MWTVPCKHTQMCMHTHIIKINKIKLNLRPVAQEGISCLVL